MCEGVSVELRLVRIGSMQYQASKARFVPLPMLVLSLLSGNIVGTLERVHCFGSFTLR